VAAPIGGLVVRRNPIVGGLFTFVLALMVAIESSSLRCRPGYETCRRRVGECSSSASVDRVASKKSPTTATWCST
jgi:hypothetical protein